MFDFNSIQIDVKKDADGALYFKIDDLISILQFEVVDNKAEISGEGLAKSLIEMMTYTKVWVKSSENDEKKKMG